ncbi:MAG: HD domain-containing protein [Lachnospiraceae bacterium]|nr:HD domain-containing protein [Lachnospiraceae bacterium]
MRDKKTGNVSLVVIICLLINVGGRFLEELLELPVWLDSFGTVLAAYTFGPFCGAVVGASANVISGIFTNPVSYIYAITSIAIGIVTGLLARKGWMRDLFGALTCSVVVTMVSVVVSTPLNLIFYEGRCGNIWGDGVFDYLREIGIPKLLSSLVGEFYVDFLDKVITMMFLFWVIRVVRRLRDEKVNRNEFDDTDVLEDINDQGRAENLTTDNAKDELTAKEETGSTDKEESRETGNAEDGEEKIPRIAEKGEPVSVKVSRKAKKKEKVLRLLFFATVGAGLCFFGNGSKALASPIDLDSNVLTVYSRDNGLPCGEANDITQSKDGILYIGTYAGLYRYNGSEFQWMDEYESIRNVNCLYNDDEGRLWIGTNDSGLSICINERIANVLKEEDGLPSNSVRCITKAADGLYYVGTTSGLEVLKLSGGLTIVDEMPQIGYAQTLSADSRGFVVTVTSDGGLHLLKNGEYVSKKELNVENEIYTCAAFDENDDLYVGTSEHSIYCFTISDDGKYTLKKIMDCKGVGSINNVVFKEEAPMFVLADDGVGYYDKNGSFEVLNTEGFNNSIDNMEQDYQGNLWFTSSRMGLLRVAASDFGNLFNKAGVEGAVTNTIAPWQNAWYVGTDNGLVIIDRDRRTEVKNQLTKDLDGIRIRCIMPDSKDHLWISTYGRGLWEVAGDGTVKTYEKDNGSFGNRARMTIELQDGSICAAGDTGVSFIKDGEVTRSLLYENGLSNAMILCLLERKDGSILAGSDGDGIVVIRDGAVVERITAANGLPSGVIMRMVEDNRGDGIFLVTSNALCYMESDHRVRTLTNFPYYNNYDVWQTKNGRLFVPGSAGIYVVDHDPLLAGEEVTADVLDHERGLTSALTANSWNYMDEKGVLYVACDSGIYSLDTRKYGNQNSSYRMMIGSVRLDGVSVPVNRGEDIQVDREVSRVELLPEVVNYTIEDPYVGYYLDGFDDEMTLIPQSNLTSITYTNIPSGNYVFHLQVLDRYRNVLEESTYRIVKESAIYDHQWFRVYMVLVAMLAVAWLTWFIVRTQIQRTLTLQQRELKLIRQQLRMGNETILAIAKTVDAKDENTSQHSLRVSEYSVMIAERYGFTKEEQENLRKAALLHDIGKISIPDSILNAPRKLTDEEYAIMKSHVTRGAEILKDFTLIDHVVEGAQFHHERYDGKGYPKGLKGENIPLYGRIIGVADAFDAMTANRVYRKHKSFDYVVSELKRCRGTQFDPKIADIMLSLIEDGVITEEMLRRRQQASHELTDVMNEEKK